MDRHVGWLRQRRHQGSGDGLPSGTVLSGGYVCKERPAALSNRPAPVSSGLGPGAGAEGQLAQARAELAQAEAQVAVAEANQRRTQLDVDRYTPLAQQQAITQQDLDNATQNNLAAKAQLQAARAQVETAKAQITAALAAVQSAKAAVETAQINLG